MSDVFTIEERNRIGDGILALAREDARVVAGAQLGSLSLGPGDRFSDLDLSFGLADGATPREVLDDWTPKLDAVVLFDLPRGDWLYRVFLFPGLLQVDVSMVPAREFGPLGPAFKLLFGEAREPRSAEPPDERELFGLAVHHGVRARVCIERGKVWEAQFWIAELRDHALEIACLRRDLPHAYGRGYDALPPEALAPWQPTLVRSLDGEELRRALAAAVDALRATVPDLAAPLEGQLRELAST